MSADRADSDRLSELWAYHLGLTEETDDEDGEEGTPLGLLPGGEDEEDDQDGVELDIDALGDAINEDFEEGDPADNGDTDNHERLELEWTDSLTERDDRISEYDGDADHMAVRDHCRQTGVARQIRDALESIGTDEHDITDEEGAVLDMRNVTRHLAGDTEVRDLYRRRTKRPGDDVAVGLSLDMSGSMSTDELDAKAAVGAFLFAVQQLGGSVVANAWQAPGSSPKVRLLSGPYERFRWEHLDTVSPGGLDPIAVGMHECAAMLRRTHAREKLLLVVTDGKPTVRSRDDLDCSSALDEAAETAEEIRALGITVVGFGFGNVSESNMAAMFVDDGYRHVDLDELPDALVECYEEQHGSTVRGVV